MPPHRGSPDLRGKGQGQAGHGVVPCSAMAIGDLIEKKRGGRDLDRGDMDRIAAEAASASPDIAGLTEWLKAVYPDALNAQETADLTLAMAYSGERLPLDGLPKPWVDKHSTGGVGDKTTLILLPLLASCGLTMVKMSGRGLGITGGTIDKLESVPGFRVDLTPEEMVKQAKFVGCALTGQTPRLAPADKTLYSLRDATGTVASVPLIVSSILSKKIAGGADTVVFDVKCGSGAFMKTLDEAAALRQGLESVGALAGLQVRAAITDMDQPLGRAAGNALEVKEAIRLLRGEEQGRLKQLCVGLAALALEAVGRPDAAAEAEKALDSGAALQMAMHWFHAQGADLDVFDEDDWAIAPFVTEVLHEGEAGWVQEIDARAIGQLVVDLGGGRKALGAAIDHRVGVEVLVEVGDRIEEGQPWLRLHAAAQDAACPKGAITVSSTHREARPVFLGS